MELILSVGEVLLYLLAGAAIIAVLAGLILFTIINPIIGGYSFVIIILGICIFTTEAKKEFTKFTQKSDLNYSYKLTDLKEFPENHPSAKCLVEIDNKQTNESLDVEINKIKNSSSNYSNNYYTDKSCDEFKNELESTIQSVNDKIESSKIDEVPIKENSESSEKATNLKNSENDASEDKDVLETVLKSHFNNFKAYNTDEKTSSFEFTNIEQLSMITQKNVAHYIQLRNQISDSKIIMDSVINPNGPIDKMSSEEEYKQFQSEILPVVNYFTENKFTKNITIINIDEIEPNHLYKVNFKTTIKDQNKNIIEETKNFANIEVRYDIHEETKTLNPQTFQVIHYEVYEIK